MPGTIYTEAIGIRDFHSLPDQIARQVCMDVVLEFLCLSVPRSQAQAICRRWIADGKHPEEFFEWNGVFDAWKWIQNTSVLAMHLRVRPEYRRMLKMFLGITKNVGGEP